LGAGSDDSAHTKKAPADQLPCKTSSAVGFVFMEMIPQVKRGA